MPHHLPERGIHYDVIDSSFSMQEVDIAVDVSADIITEFTVTPTMSGEGGEGRGSFTGRLGFVMAAAASAVGLAAILIFGTLDMFGIFDVY